MKAKPTIEQLVHALLAMDLRGDISDGEGDEPPWFTTKRAAEYLAMTPKALLMHVARGTLRPDCFGQRGRTRSHRFSRETRDRFIRGEQGPSDEGR